MGFKPDLRRLVQRLQQSLPDAELTLQVLPNTGDLRLALLDPDYHTGPLPPEVMRAVIANPAYWCFCWGSGLALARFLQVNPHWVQNKRVLDLGSGSGVGAIAAAKAGAKTVHACDNDPDALAATAFNGELNQVELNCYADLRHAPSALDLILLADVLYDASNLPLLEHCLQLAPRVLVADSRIKSLPHPAFRQIASLEAITQPNLGEFDEFNITQLFVNGLSMGE